VRKRILQILDFLLVCGGVFFIIEAIVMLVWVVVFRFQHPQLTETQLFLKTWGPGLLVPVCFVIGLFVLSLERKGK
jgi:hypothetical protein